MAASSPTVLFLPDAGKQNPFQHLLAELLRQHGFGVRTSRKRRLFTLLRAVQQHQPDLVYFDWLHSFLIGEHRLATFLKSTTFLLEFLFIRYVKRIPILHTLHNLQNHAGRSLGWERRLYGFFLRRCHRIRVYSTATRQRAVERFGLDANRIAVIPDVPYHFYYPNTVSREEARRRLNLAEEAFVYLFFGNVKPYKGIEQLLDTFPLLARSVDLVLVVGLPVSPHYGHSLQQRAAGSNVRFYDAFVPEEEVQLYFKAADVAVFPFRQIEHSGSVDLAMAFSLPVVTCANPPLRSLLSHQTELLFTQPAELEACLLQAAQASSEQRQAWGAENFRRANTADYLELVNFFRDHGPVTSA